MILLNVDYVPSDRTERGFYTTIIKFKSSNISKSDITKAKSLLAFARLNTNSDMLNGYSLQEAYKTLDCIFVNMFGKENVGVFGIRLDNLIFEHLSNALVSCFYLNESKSYENKYKLSTVHRCLQRLRTLHKDLDSCVIDLKKHL